jgi:TolB-like protein
LAKWLDASGDITRTLTIFGTPGYIAPEQAQGPAATLKPSSDIYSLGAILFDLLVGRPPFLGEHALAVIHQAAEKPAPKLRSLVKSADKDLETICARCLEREPTARYHSASDLAEDLERWLEGRSIIARPVSPTMQLWRWSRRNSVLASSFAACLLLGSIALAWRIQSRQWEATVQEDELASHSIAVLPFLDLDTAREADDFSAALAKALQSELTRLGPARVVPVVGDIGTLASAGNSSAISATARNYRTRALLSGTKRRIKDQLRISTRLMDSDGNVLWRKVIDIDPNALTAERLSHFAAAALYPMLDSKDWSPLILAAEDPGLRNETARDFILAGRTLLDAWTIANTDRAIECFQKAINAEPGSALARASYASAVATRAHFQPERPLLDKAEISALKALELDPWATEGHRALAGVLYQQGNFPNALQEALSAIEAGGPEEHVVGEIGQISKMTGKPDVAIDWFAKMARSEARPANFFFLLADCWADLCEDKRAQIVYERVSQLRPDLPEGWIGLCHLRLLQKDFAGARDIYLQNRNRHNESVYTNEIAAQTEFFARNFPAAEEIYQALAKSDLGGGGSFYGAMSYASALGRSKQMTGDKAGEVMLQDCLAIEKSALRQIPDHPEILYRLAAIESSLGDIDSSASHLKKAFMAGWLDYRSLALDPRFDSLRGDTRYRQISEAMATRVASLRRSQSTEVNDWNTKNTTR